MRLLAVFLLLGLLTGCAILPVGHKPPTRDRADIRIRDPFVLTDPDSQTYYMYATTTARNEAGNQRHGVGVYTSRDLSEWTGPTPVMLLPEDWWADSAVWAPEVHQFNGKYYLFTTLTGETSLPAIEGRPPLHYRGTQIFRADNPMGPFRPFSNKPHTPLDWMALDGTLWVEDGIPYMIFCHEWIQVTDGTMILQRLTPDLSSTIGEPWFLFKATDAPWVRNLRSVDVKYRDEIFDGTVTDGPCVYRTNTGKLLMVWSSFGDDKYAIGVAESTTGRVAGPWVQQPVPLFSANGGHSMIFRTLDGQLAIALHQPNSQNERAHFFELIDEGNTLSLGRELAADR
jgi:GH43 family beta-xylosidase